LFKKYRNADRKILMNADRRTMKVTIEQNRQLLRGFSFREIGNGITSPENI
jgi:hypothetical protein